MEQGDQLLHFTKLGFRDQLLFLTNVGIRK
jgi:hypothetical protein